MSENPFTNNVNDGLTFFNRLAEEKAEEIEAQNAGVGVISSLFGRLWRSETAPTTINPVTEAPTFYASSSANTSAATLCTNGAAVGSDSPESLRNVGNVSPTINPLRRSPSDTASQESENSRKLSERLVNLFKGNIRNGLVDYNRSNFKQYWMPDSTGKECYQCEERFTAFRRRHHCRLCGQIFCARCCNLKVPGSALGYTGDLRLCHYCAKMMAQYLPPEADKDLNQRSEDFPTELPDTALQRQHEHVADPEHTLQSSIATVSAASGSLIWTKPQSAAPSRKNSLSTPPPSYKPPTMLCVQELFSQHEEQLNRGRRQPSVSSGLCEEDESGPDWFRNMDTGLSNLAPGKDEKISCQPSSDEFEPKPISDLRSMSLMEAISIDVSTEPRKVSLEHKTSVSPTKPKPFGLDDDIERIFDLRSEQMLTYLFNRERIRDVRWKSLILSVARKAATSVRIDVEKRKDSMNILSYIHIKKLVSAKEPSIETVCGVVCSKSILHAEMCQELSNASVMIVAGSIEYERIPGKLSTIEPIICQEAEFLSKQVDRILTRRPSLLLVEGGVSRVAGNLLRCAGVTVVTNVKANVLFRIARSTGADILPSSDAQLIQQNIGFCPLFFQKYEHLNNGKNKILLSFGECPVDRGCSIILRGNNARELRAVKRVLQLMISLIYSAQLEKAYLSLFNTRLAFQISNCQVCETRRENIEQVSEQSDFECMLSDSRLTLSPFIEYEPPFLETSVGRESPLLGYFKLPLYRFGMETDFDEMEKEEIEETDRREAIDGPDVFPDSPKHSFCKLPAESWSPINSLIDGLASYRAMGGKLFRKRIQRIDVDDVKVSRSRSLDRVRRNDVLCPFVHQRVAVLFGSFSPKSPNAPYFCVRPWVLSMEFYADNDMTLGEFLTKYCFNKTYECPSSNCDIPMLDHSRKMVYSRVCIEVTTQIVVQSGSPSAEENGTGNAQSGNSNIITWHYCPSCKISSPVVQLNSAVWHLSFGKYLDYLANSGFTKGCVSSPNQQQTCSHCLFHEHVHFFAQSSYVTTFKITPIRPFDVQFSPVVCKIQPQQFSQKALLDGVTRMASLADDIVVIAEDRLRIFAENENLLQYAGAFPLTLRQLLEKTTSIIRDKRVVAVDMEKEERSVINSHDLYAVKANETLMQIREAIYNLISTWNEQAAVLAATLRALKKGEDSGSISEIPDFSVEKIDDPFPSHLHLGLKLHPRVGVVVRDIQDPRGSYKPDIGSIIAYALSAADYEDCRKRVRVAAGGQDVPLNLNSSSYPSDGAALAAEHMEIEFQDQHGSYFVKAYYAERFRLLRKLLIADGEDAFIRSLSQSTFWTPQGGKSGSFFYRTQDDRFIVKQMSRFEIQSFTKFAPNYLDYIKTAVTENRLTALCKVFGVFRVGVKSKTQQLKVDILIMEYLFYKRDVQQTWDLKGSLRNRMAAAGGTSSDVLLDENLMKDLWNKQLYVFPHSKAALNQAISNDSHFLSSQHVMDYSLLVGVDEVNGKLVLGIVDYMRTYTLDKKVEYWVKTVAIPGAHLPTILSPEMYCTRFSEAIDTYFPVVPDQWTGLDSAVTY